MVFNFMKILLVEDNHIAQLAAKLTLEQAGFIVAIAINDAEAYTQINNQAFELILMDISLNNNNNSTDGFDIANNIRQSNNPNRSTPIIALTAYSDDNYRQTAIDLGMDGYLVKPITIEKLLQAIEMIHEKKANFHDN